LVACYYISQELFIVEQYCDIVQSGTNLPTSLRSIILSLYSCLNIWPTMQLRIMQTLLG
jgi:hypothetical protein